LYSGDADAAVAATTAHFEDLKLPASYIKKVVAEIPKIIGEQQKAKAATL
jgi:hypothetical protein